MTVLSPRPTSSSGWTAQISGYGCATAQLHHPVDQIPIAMGKDRAQIDRPAIIEDHRPGQTDAVGMARASVADSCIGPAFDLGIGHAAGECYVGAKLIKGKDSWNDFVVDPSDPQN